MSTRVTHTDDDEGRRERDVRNVCERIYGWSDDQATLVDDTTNALLSTADRCGVIALRGKGDLVPTAHTIHRRLVGADRPFVVCDPRRANREASARSAANRKTSADALRVGAGGSVCIRLRRLPSDYHLLAPSRRMTDGTQLFVCLSGDDRVVDMLCPPIRIPSLTQRSDLGRLVSECLADATRDLGVRSMRIPRQMHEAVLRHATMLADLEKVTLRIAALKSAPNTTMAAAWLGMNPPVA